MLMAPEISLTITYIKIGIVSTAFIADATPAALTAHTKSRALYGQVVDSFLRGNTNYTWTNWTGPDVLFGGGAEQFFPKRTHSKAKTTTNFLPTQATKSFKINRVS